jgi:hypothetical protein
VRKGTKTPPRPRLFARLPRPAISRHPRRGEARKLHALRRAWRLATGRREDSGAERHAPAAPQTRAAVEARDVNRRRQDAAIGLPMSANAPKTGRRFSPARRAPPAGRLETLAARYSIAARIFSGQGIDLPCW